MGFTLKDPGLALEVDKVSHTLRGAQHQYPARIQSVMKQRHELFLQVRAHVDQEIAAADQIEFRERRVLDQVGFGKNEHVSDGLVDTVRTAIRLLLVEKVG